MRGSLLGVDNSGFAQGAVESERRLVVLIERHGGIEVGPQVEGGVRGEVERHGGGDPALGGDFAVHLKGDIERPSNAAGQFRLDLDLDLAGRRLL